MTAELSLESEQLPLQMIYISTIPHRGQQSHFRATQRGKPLPMVLLLEPIHQQVMLLFGIGRTNLSFLEPIRLKECELQLPAMWALEQLLLQLHFTLWAEPIFVSTIRLSTFLTNLL